MAEVQRPFIDIKSQMKFCLNTETGIDLIVQGILDNERCKRKLSEKVRPRGPTLVPAEPPPALPLGLNLHFLGINIRSGNPVCLLSQIIELRSNVPNTADDAVTNESDPMPSKRRRLSSSTHPEQQPASKPAATNNDGPSCSVPGTGCQKSKMHRARAADKRTIDLLRNKLLHRTGAKRRKDKNEDNELMTVRCTMHSNEFPRSQEGNLPNFDLLRIVHK